MRTSLFALSLILSASALAQPGTTNWMFATGDAIYSSPAIGPDGTIYIASYDYKVYAIRPNGTKRWEFDVNGHPPKFPQMWSSPAVGSDGTIYFGTGDTYVYALNTNGTLRWRFQTGDLVWSDVAIGPDQTIYVTGFDTNFYALYPSNQVRWLFQPADQMFADPVFAPNSVLYFGADDGKLYAIGATGTKLWDFQGGDGTTASPAVDADGTVYFSSAQGATGQRLYAVHPDGSKKWDYLTGGNLESSPAIGPDGTIYVGSNDQKLYAVNPNGTPKWTALTTGQVRSSPAVAADGTIYVGSDDGTLYAFDSTGSNIWSVATGGAIYSSPTIAPDGTVYIGSASGTLFAIGGTAGLANTPWPMFRGNARHTGRSAQEPLNYPPFLDPLTNLTVSEGQAIGFTCHAVDPDKHALTFTLDPPAPEGAHMDPVSGVFSWTPGEAEGGTTQMITVRVTDNGSPAQSVERVFAVSVEEINLRPIFEPISDQTINEGETIDLTFQVHDPDQPEQNISYTMTQGPAFATLNALTGQFSWEPGEADGPTNIEVVVIATDDGIPSLIATQRVHIAVTEVNQAPQLDDISDQAISVGETLSLTAKATDADLPANSLSYSLTEHPAGATINSVTGLISWTPTASGTNEFAVRVMDNGLPPLADTNRFSVMVTMLQRPLITLVRVEDGNVRIKWESVPGKHYRVLGKTDLQLTDWTDLSGLIPATEQMTEWTGPISGSKKFLSVEEFP